MEKEVFKTLSRKQADHFIKWVGNEKARFLLLVELFFRGDYRLTQHAAWPMANCAKNFPILAKPYFKKFIDQLSSNEKTFIASKRNIMRLLQIVNAPKRYQGKLMDSCFQFLISLEEAMAVKAFSLTVLDKLSTSNPEILPENNSIIEARWEYETHAVESMGRKILQKLKD